MCFKKQSGLLLGFDKHQSYTILRLEMACEHSRLNSVACNIADTDLMLSAFSSANFSTVLQDLLEENCQLQVRMGS